MGLFYVLPTKLLKFNKLYIYSVKNKTKNNSVNTIRK